MKKTTSFEYSIWLEYLADKKEKEANGFSPLYWYLAQVSAEVRRSMVKHPEKVRLSDFILSFSSAKPPKKLTLEETKAIWKGIVGYKESNKKSLKRERNK